MKVFGETGKAKFFATMDSSLLVVKSDLKIVKEKRMILLLMDLKSNARIHHLAKQVKKWYLKDTGEIGNNGLYMTPNMFVVPKKDSKIL